MAIFKLVMLGLQFLFGVRMFLLVVDFLLQSIDHGFVVVAVVEDVVTAIVVEHSLL